MSKSKSKSKSSEFTFNVRDLIRRPGEMREQPLDITNTVRLGEGMVAVQPGTHIGGNIRLESLHEGVLASAQIETRAAGECSRCLIPIELPVEVEFQELFAYPTDEACEFEVHDDHIDLEPLTRDAVVLSLPFQPVCREDCPGLDPVTGERLADQPVGTASPSVDPRWSALIGFEASTDSSASGSADGADADKEES